MAKPELWIEFVAPAKLCGLCANTGIIDTRGIVSPAGFVDGGVFFCICPNGRDAKKQGKELTTDELTSALRPIG